MPNSFRDFSLLNDFIFDWSIDCSCFLQMAATKSARFLAYPTTKEHAANINSMITDKYVFFWNGPFSQWYPANFTIDDVEYNCAEQYMMAQKALLFNDSESHKMIMESIWPDEQKKGKRIVRPLFFMPLEKKLKWMKIKTYGNFEDYQNQLGVQLDDQ